MLLKNIKLCTSHQTTAYFYLSQANKELIKRLERKNLELLSKSLRWPPFPNAQMQHRDSILNLGPEK
jgi:hypothetical protein